MTRPLELTVCKLIVVYILYFAFLAFMVYYFGRDQFGWKICSRRPPGTKGPLDCWTCYDNQSCKTPWRTFCTRESANETRFRGNIFEEQKNIPNAPYDTEAKRFIIQNESDFSCLLFDFNCFNKTPVEVRGCVFRELYAVSFSYDSENHTRVCSTADKDFAYECFESLCNQPIKEVKRKRLLFDPPFVQTPREKF